MRYFIDSIMSWFTGPVPTNFVEIPLSQKMDAAPKKPGRLYVSPMPFGPYDPSNRLIKEFKVNRINVVLALVTDDEVRRKGRTTLWQTYAELGVEVLRLPFDDFTAPMRDEVTSVMPRILALLDLGNKVSVHCNAGVGRTGVLAACICSRVMALNGTQALDHITHHMMVRLTDEQRRFVEKWVDGESA